MKEWITKAEEESVMETGNVETVHVIRMKAGDGEESYAKNSEISVHLPYFLLHLFLVKFSHCR